MNWILLLTGFSIVLSAFLLVFSFNSQYSNKLRTTLFICGMIGVVICILLTIYILENPLTSADI